MHTDTLVNQTIPQEKSQFTTQPYSIKAKSKGGSGRRNQAKAICSDCFDPDAWWKEEEAEEEKTITVE